MSSQEEQAKEYIQNFIIKKNKECPQLDGLFCCPICYGGIVFKKASIKCMKYNFGYKFKKTKIGIKRVFNNKESESSFMEYIFNFDDWFIPFNKKIIRKKEEEWRRR